MTQQTNRFRFLCESLIPSHTSGFGITELTHEPVITLGCFERCQVLALEVFDSVVKKGLNQLTHTRPADIFTCSTPVKAWLRVQPKGDGSQQDH